ncbi:transglycosylase SLT domain-containing protein, partial [bacterium]|nr:transglycosylase SLT domain-containing protein [candidate division CSSED10-310 bacterium]
MAMIIVAFHIVRADVVTYRDKNGVVHLTNKKRSFSVSSKQEQSNGKSSSNFKDNKETIIKHIDRIAISEGIDPALVKAIAHAESAFDSKAVSKKGAIGVMQLMPETAKRFNVKDITAIEDNI